MNFCTCKNDNIRDKIITMQLPTIVLCIMPDTVGTVSPKEQFHSSLALEGEELSELVKSSKSTTCMLDFIPTKL